MEIEVSEQEHTWQAFFSPIVTFSTSMLVHEKSVIENAFSSYPHQPIDDLQLTLTDNLLLFAIACQQQAQPLAAIQLSFDLKFEILYEQQRNLRSQKIGIRLFYSEQHSFSFFSGNSAVVNDWVWCLSKKLNQKGFHQMFKPLRKLGKGNFATVYEVERIIDGQKFAVKAFSRQAAFSAKNGKESLINQLNVMRKLNEINDPNILRLYGVYESDNSIYVVLELLRGGQLFHRIQQRSGNFTAQEVREFMLGLLQGMSHMHSTRIMHRDLKPQNIMLRSTDSMTPVIVDFGLATNADIQKYLFFRCGTPGYVAPQIIGLNECKHIEPQCDIFSAGVMFHILLTRKPVFQGTKYQQVYKKNKEMSINFQNERYNMIDPQAMSLLKRMLVANPQERISADLALKHPYFQSKDLPQSPLKIGSPCLTSASKRVNHRFNMR